jgi:RNA polymerase sigma-70 factor (ECF subfamily)
MNERPDQDLVIESRQGDKGAYALLIRRYYQNVFLVCLGILGNVPDAEDIAQDAMLKGFVEIEKLRDSSQFGSWILKIAKNMCINLVRRRKHRRQITAAKAMQTRQEAEQDDVLWHAIERLPQEHRLPLVMYYFDGESVEKVAGRLSISRSGAYRKIRCAVRQLHKLLIRGE